VPAWPRRCEISDAAVKGLLRRRTAAGLIIVDWTGPATLPSMRCLRSLPGLGAQGGHCGPASAGWVCGSDYGLAIEPPLVVRTQ
jgi:hypothetical protein